MKLSVSLPDEDVVILDHYARRCGLPSRSAALHAAVLHLRDVQLEQEYDEAFAEWAASGEQEVWETTVADGLRDATW